MDDTYIYENFKINLTFFFQLTKSIGRMIKTKEFRVQPKVCKVNLYPTDKGLLFCKQSNSKFVIKPAVAAMHSLGSMVQFGN